jgi:hypothetical protein
MMAVSRLSELQLWTVSGLPRAIAQGGGIVRLCQHQHPSHLPLFEACAPRHEKPVRESLTIRAAGGRGCFAFGRPSAIVLEWSMWVTPGPKVTPALGSALRSAAKFFKNSRVGTITLPMHFISLGDQHDQDCIPSHAHRHSSCQHPGSSAGGACVRIRSRPRH